MRIVFTNGCFDILHRGHVEYLEASSLLGDYLIIGLNSDESVKKLKGSSRPINNQNDRKYVLERLECVNKVIIFDEDTPYELIKKIKPNVITKGGDYKVEEVAGHELVEKTYILPFKDGYSTTNMIKRINYET